MGGAASATIAIGEVEDLVACTLFLGRAIAAISFPDMFRIYDFHSPDAPPLRKEDDDDEDLPDFFGIANMEAPKVSPEDEKPKKVYKTEGFFALEVGQDKVYLEDVNRQNECGWLPLHACCHSQATAELGIKIIDEMVRTGKANFDLKTTRGPGPFNSGWTPLQMAAAYGVRTIVERLLKEGADANCQNSMTWTPLMECCHRGFAPLAQLLVSNGANVNYIPDEEVCARSPFLRAPPQSPLAEAARVGCLEIVKYLLDHGANKDMVNGLGWSPMHEAAFYNHTQIVQTLLVYGADATLKTKQGALAFQLACLPQIREAIRDLGGPEAVADDPNPFSMLAMMAGLSPTPESTGPATKSGEDTKEPSRGGEKDDKVQNAEASTVGSPGKRLVKKTSKLSMDSKQNEEKEEERPLHMGGLIGDLPSLNLKPTVVHPKRKVQPPKKSKMKLKVESKVEGPVSPSRNVPPDAPEEFLCELSKSFLKEPMRTPYGHVFENKIITAWF